MNSKINKTIIPTPSGRNALKQAENTLIEMRDQFKAKLICRERHIWEAESVLKIVRAEIRKQSKAGKIVKLTERKEAA